MDAIFEWVQAQQRVIDLVEPLTAEQADTTVPACPDWTVRDLLSHMVGLDADVLDGDEPDDHNEEWTKAQVAARVDRDVTALIEEWTALTEPLRAWMAENTTRPLGDVVIHEQDLRGALGVTGAQDTEGLESLRDTIRRTARRRRCGTSAAGSDRGRLDVGFARAGRRRRGDDRGVGLRPDPCPDVAAFGSSSCAAGPGAVTSPRTCPPSSCSAALPDDDLTETF